MYLDEIVKLQQRGEPRGIPSICSAHPTVLRAAMQNITGPLLIEATCNQVNQFGGYTGRTPVDFVRFVKEIAQENKFPFENIILGGDHLGPSVWQDESADSGMKKADRLIRDYVEAGFTKVHLDCSMRLADDPEGFLNVETSAKRAARLAKVAETWGNENLRYVIGTEVPLPGGATEHEEGVNVTNVTDLQRTIECAHEEFIHEGLEEAWERIIAVVVQPGVEYGDDFVLPYVPDRAQELSKFIKKYSMVYEAHSTDYQTREALKSLVQDKFAILKVGPALTFAFREAVYGLAMIENEIIKKGDRSNIILTLDQAMIQRPEYWIKYYHGSDEEIAFKRKYSLSDRIRYYWPDASVQQAYNQMLTTLNQFPIPTELIKEYLPDISKELFDRGELITPEQIMLLKVIRVLDDYNQACNLTRTGSIIANTKLN